jgi:multidrug resistance protein
VKQTSQQGILELFRGNEAFFLLCLQVCILNIGQGLIAPILPLYAQEFEVSATLVGFLLTSQALPRLFTSLPTGRLADRVGSNRLLTVSAGIVTISALVAGLAPNYQVLLFTRLLQGIGAGISFTAGLTYTANVSKAESRARFISLYQGSFLFGNSIGPVIGGVTAEYFGYRAPFYVYAILALIVTLWMYIRLPDSRLEMGRSDVKRRESPGFLSALGSLIRQPGVLVVTLIGFSASFTRSGSRNMAFPLMGTEIGLSESQIGLIVTVIFFMTVVALYWIGALADRFGPKAILVPSGLVLAGTLVGMVYASNFGVFLVGAAVYGLAAGAASPVPAAYISNVVEENMQGTALGFFRTFNDVGLLLGPLVMGLVADQSNIGNGVLVNAGLVILITMLFLVLAPKGSKVEVNAE